MKIDFDQLYLDLLAAWGDSPLDEKEVKRLLTVAFIREKKDTIKEVLAMPVMREELVLNKSGHNITTNGKAKPEKLRNDLRHDISFVLYKKLKNLH